MDPMQMMNPMNQMNQMALRSALVPSSSSGLHHRHHPASSAMQSYPYVGNHHQYGTAFPGISSYSSSVVTMTSDGLGRTRQVYEASSSTRLAPGGVRETQSTVRDSRTGRNEMSIGHHLHDKSHVVKKSKNVYTGQEDHEEDFVNVEEDEEATFEREWQRRAAAGYRSAYERAYSRPSPALTIPDYSPPPRRQLLALPAPPAPSATATRPASTSSSSSRATVSSASARQHARPSYAATAAAAPVSSNSREAAAHPVRSRSSSITSGDRISNHLFAHNHHVNGFTVPSASSSFSVARPTSPLDQMRRERRDKGKQRRERPY